MTFDTDKPIIMEILYRGEVQRPNGIIRLLGKMWIQTTLDKRYNAGII